MARPAAIAIASLETTARRSSRANSRGSEPCSASRVRESSDAGERRRRRGDEDEHAGDAHSDLERVDDTDGSEPSNAAAIPTSGASSHSSAEGRLAVRHRIRREADRPDEDRHHDDEADRGEERPGQRSSGLGRLLGEIGHRLETGVGEHRERKREGEVGPVLATREAEAGVEGVGENRNASPRSTRSPARPGRGARRRPSRGAFASSGRAAPRDHGDEPAADEGVPRRLAQRRHADRPGEIVGRETTPRAP